MPADLPPLISVPSEQVISIGDLQPKSLIIACGAGQVSISLRDGKVTLTNCTVDEGATAFWKAVELIAPMKKP